MESQGYVTPAITCVPGGFAVRFVLDAQPSAVAKAPKPAYVFGSPGIVVPSQGATTFSPP
jgi:hypothetical protein